MVWDVMLSEDWNFGTWIQGPNVISFHDILARENFGTWIQKHHFMTFHTFDKMCDSMIKWEGGGRDTYIYIYRVGGNFYYACVCIHVPKFSCGRLTTQSEYWVAGRGSTGGGSTGRQEAIKYGDTWGGAQDLGARR